MGWYKITTERKTYVLDPERLWIRREDGEGFRSPEDLLDEWSTHGTVEPLAPDADPVEVMRRHSEPRPLVIAASA